MLPIPYLLLALAIALFGTYQGGYHIGWTDRDEDMQLEIAKKNDEARDIERNMTDKLNQQSAKLKEANDAIKLYEAGLINQHSIGFSTLKSDVNQKTGVRTITELKLYEGSAVLWGANPVLWSELGLAFACAADGNKPSDNLFLVGLSAVA